MGIVHGNDILVVVERLGARYHKVVGVRRVKVMPKNNLPKPPGESQSMFALQGSYASPNVLEFEIFI